MPFQAHFSRWPRRWPLWIAAGLILRLVFIWFPRPIDPDTWDYLELGHNLLHHGIYALGSGRGLTPTLFRLPAYPIFLATFELFFVRIWPSIWLNAVFLAQAAAGTAAGLLLAAFARRHLTGRAAEAVLILAMLCPFTAIYDAVALTESLSVSAIALGIYAAGRVLAAEAEGYRDLRALALAGCAAALATLLRPDGILLFAALAMGFSYYIARGSAQNRASFGSLHRALSATAIYTGVFLLLLAPWVARNWITFHVFQPLAPRYLNDPGERSNVGFYRWLRTWSVEYVTTATVFWNVGSENIDLADILPSAYDSPEQRIQSSALIAEYNRTNSLSAGLDQRFDELAAERIHAHPIRYYVALPLERDADMLFRPRTEQFYLEVFWWQWKDYPAQSAWAILLGLMNLFYVAAAAWGFLRDRVPWPWMLGGYLLMRLVLLGTMENPEPRYTLECFPIFVVAAAAALTRAKPCAAPALSPIHPVQSQPAVRQSFSG